MEVHHHSHTSRKKWTHYFWEFLMLFLAVFCGFLAEYKLEHTIEHQREKKYIGSLIEDLKTDTASIQHSAAMRQEVCKMIDTVIALLKSEVGKSASSKIYYLIRKIPYSEGRFSFNSKTYEQMKYSGNLRLVRNSKVLDMISDYYHDAGNATIRGPLDMNFENRHDLYLSIQKLFDAGVFHRMMDPYNPLIFKEPDGHPPLLTNDAGVINEICTRLHFMYGTHRVIMADNERLKMKAIRLIENLREAYHLK